VCGISPHTQVQAIEGVIRALEDERLSWDSLDAACTRVRRMKERFLLPYRDPSPREARQSAGLGEWGALAQEISERGGEPMRFPWSAPS
jgi:hypothetical protein